MCSSDVLVFASQCHAHNAEENQASKDDKERNKGSVRKGNWDVHAEQSTNEVERNENRRQERDLAEYQVRVCTLRDAVDGKLSQVVTVGARQNLFKVAEVGDHGDDVILYIAEIKSNVHSRCDLVVLIATLGKASQDISFASKKAHESHGVLAHSANRPQELVRIVLAGYEDAVLNGVSLQFDVADDWGKAIHDIVTIKQISTNNCL